MRAKTDLRVTGSQARFGRGMMEDVAERVLEEFSARLERQLAGAQAQEATDGNGAAGRSRRRLGHGRRALKNARRARTPRRGRRPAGGRHVAVILRSLADQRQRQALEGLGLALPSVEEDLQGATSSRRRIATLMATSVSSTASTTETIPSRSRRAIFKGDRRRSG